MKSNYLFHDCRLSGIEAVVRDPELSVGLTTVFPRYNAWSGPHPFGFHQ